MNSHCIIASVTCCGMRLRELEISKTTIMLQFSKWVATLLHFEIYYCFKTFLPFLANRPGF